MPKPPFTDREEWGRFIGGERVPGNAQRIEVEKIGKSIPVQVYSGLERVPTAGSLNVWVGALPGVSVAGEAGSAIQRYCPRTDSGAVHKIGQPVSIQVNQAEPRVGRVIANVFQVVVGP